MLTLFEIIKGTPYWAWGILGYLLFVGVKSLYPRTVAPGNLIVMPLFFTAWSLIGLYQKPFLQAIAWSVPLAQGVLVGWSLLRYPLIKYDSESRLASMAGSAVPLVLSLLFFCFKYWIAIAPLVIADQFTVLFFRIFGIGLSGFLTGVSWGRFAQLIVQVKKIS